MTRRSFLARAGSEPPPRSPPRWSRRAPRSASPAPPGRSSSCSCAAGSTGSRWSCRRATPTSARRGPASPFRAGALLPLDRGFGLHPALAPIHPLWGRGQLAVVPAVATPDVSRSHFQAQDCLERGGASTGAAEGWLDRVLDTLGPGTTFRSVDDRPERRPLPRRRPALDVADQPRRVQPGRPRRRDRGSHRRGPREAVHRASTTPSRRRGRPRWRGSASRALLQAQTTESATPYPDDDFAKRLAELARLIRSDIGLRVACVDVGGWDMHTNLGTVDGGAMKTELGKLGAALGAFTTDLGDRLGDVTVVVMSEFGRRVTENANAGTDHGHGGVALLLGRRPRGRARPRALGRPAPRCARPGGRAGVDRLPRRARRGGQRPPGGRGRRPRRRVPRAPGAAVGVTA